MKVRFHTVGKRDYILGKGEPRNVELETEIPVQTCGLF